MAVVARGKPSAVFQGPVGAFCASTGPAASTALCRARLGHSTGRGVDLRRATRALDLATCEEHVDLLLYREAHALLEELAEATLAGTRKAYKRELATVPLLIIDDLGMRKLAHTAAEDLLELIMRRYERASTLLTSNRPVDDWGKLLGDTAAVTALLDRLLHHAHVLKCGPRSWRTKVLTDLQSGDSVR